MKKEHFKSIAIASFVIFLFAIICLIISINTSASDKLILKDIACIFVSVVSFIIALSSFIVFINKKDEPKE